MDNRGMNQPDPTPSAVPNPALLSDMASLLLAEEAAARAATASGLPRGPMTGFKGLDAELGGYLVPGLHFLLAAPGAGKTSLCLQIAGQCGCPALFVSCEMRPVEILRRVVAQTSGTYLGRLRNGELSEAALKQQIEKAASAYPRLAVQNATQPTPATSILEAAKGLRERFDSPHLLIILDSLTDWAASLAGDMTEYQANETALNALKFLSETLVCPIVVIVHRNRAGQKAEGESQMFAGKATGRIEYIGESLWNLEHFGSKEPDASGQTKKKLTLLKNRNGNPFRDLTLVFEGRLQKFKEA